MKKILAIASIALIGLAGAAHAATLQVTLGPSVSFGSGTAVTPNIDLNTYSGLTLNNSVIVPTPAAPGPYVQPSGPLFGNSFLAVLGPDQSDPPGTNGTANFKLSLAPSKDVFGFTWGTIDRFNSIVLTDSNNTSFMITGADILNHIAGSVNGHTQEDVKFFDPFGSIVTAVLASTRNAFEAGNFGQAEMPLPPALVLFGSAVLGFAFFARMRQRKTA